MNIVYPPFSLVYRGGQIPSPVWLMCLPAPDILAATIIQVAMEKMVK